MESREKLGEFKVSIRRKQVGERIANLRLKLHSSQPPQVDSEKAIARIKEIFANATYASLYNDSGEIVQFSQNPEVVTVLKEYFQGFYRLLTEVDAHNKEKSKADQLYSIIATILINIVSLQEIDFLGDNENDLAGPVIDNVRNPKRELDTIWLMSNILYRGNQLSRLFMLSLLSKDVTSYIKMRLNKSFESQSATTIFYYFVGAVIANLSVVQNFRDAKVLLQQIDSFSKLQNEQCYLYILEGLSHYAPSFRLHQYQIFATNILQKCQNYCRVKKTRFVSKYLDVVANFITGEANNLQQTEQGKKKMALEQYERFKKYGMIKNMQYCIENRSPDVKRKIFEIGWLILRFYWGEIDLQMEDYYLSLAEEVKNIEKYDEKVVLPLLKYLEELITGLLKMGNIQKDSQYSESLVRFIEATCFFEKIEHLLRLFPHANKIVDCSFDILAYLQDYGIEYLMTALQGANILPTLQAMQITEVEIVRKRDILVQYIEGHQGFAPEL